VELLAADDAEGFRRFCCDFYLGGKSLVSLFDEVLAPAFMELGEQWYQGRIEVYQERRACEICQQVLHDFRQMLPHPSPDAPVAMGGTFAGDPYMLTTTMAELAMREAGWRSIHCGYQLPVETLIRALNNRRPRLLWLSISNLSTAESFAGASEGLFHTALTQGATVAIGGRGITGEVRQRIRHSVYGDRLGLLGETARMLFKPGDDAVA
jgi:methanogenic corrinoid protein MtbC1